MVGRQRKRCTEMQRLMEKQQEQDTVRESDTGSCVLGLSNPHTQLIASSPPQLPHSCCFTKPSMHECVPSV